MFIDSIIIHNYRAYKGHNKISFKPDKKNIFLIAGNNGFGKTTFLTSLVWCLYGKLMVDVDEKFRRDINDVQGYKNYARQSLHKNLANIVDSYKISAEERKQIIKNGYSSENKYIKEAAQYYIEVSISNVFIPSIPCRTITIRRTYDYFLDVESIEVLIDGQVNELAKEVGYDIFINDFVLSKDIAKFFFFDAEKIVAMREMILSPDVEGRRKALAKLLPFQKADFKGIFKAMDGCPVNVRLLDPPLHEFVPHDAKGQEEMAKAMGVTVQEIKKRVESLCEHNPMLGHRGCRLGNTYPEITEMQTQAILGAAIELKKEGYDPHPEIMVPLTGILYEFEAQEKVIRDAAAALFEKEGMEIPFKVGTMIEIPRAALTANRIASRAEYFSFGTNDLTQMTFGYSRDDIASFLPVYLEKKILKVDPFQVLDQNGVGQLIEMAVDKGRSVRPDLKCGICGEHGGEPSSVKFCHKVGLNYVSCSPFRVPIARLAAAQAAVEE